jgi:hypothetical protein
VELLWGVDRENGQGRTPWVVVFDGEEMYACMEILFVETRVNILFVGQLRPKKFVN